jgi:ferredoxin
MTWVVTALCKDNVDTACVAECPVECFYAPNEVTEEYPNMLYISPDECIDCGACEPACPWEAIFQDESVPPVFESDTALNAKCDEDRDNFTVAQNDEKDSPSPEEVAANKAKHGYTD